MSIDQAAPPSSEALPTARLDTLPLWLVPTLVVCALPLVGSWSTWATLTIAGLAMGMIVFVMASGLTLVFGLMRILNLGHGAFIGLGAFVAASTLGLMTSWTNSPSALLNFAAMVPAMLVAILVAAAVGWAFERALIQTVAGQPLKVILTTLGGLIIGEELIKVIWGPDPIVLVLPVGLQGSFIIGGTVIEKYRLTAAAVGLAVFLAMLWTLNRTKLGLLIRAGIQNREMVESFGYRIRHLFLGVFVTGCSLAALGGVLWGLYEQLLDAHIGESTLVVAIIVIVIGGLGSTGGCFIGALLVGLLTNYAGFLIPKLTLVSNILLLVIVVSWRPEGLYPVARH
jgi:branched-chain amino acid transport system permease protein